SAAGPRADNRSERARGTPPVPPPAPARALSMRRSGRRCPPRPRRSGSSAPARLSHPKGTAPLRGRPDVAGRRPAALGSRAMHRRRRLLVLLTLVIPAAAAAQTPPAGGVLRGPSLIASGLP